jgi:uncharacterized repeat protein (TIGR01451 family)
VDDDGVAVVASDDATVDFEADDPVIDLELSQHFEPATVPAGAPSELVVSVTNRGPDPASAVVVTEVLPGGVAYVGDDASGAYDPAAGTWTIGDIGVDETVTLTIATTVDAPGEFTAVGEVTAAGQTDVDSTPGDGGGDDWDDATVAGYTVLAAASIGDTVWTDENTDGVMDAGEAPFAGVSLRLTMPDGTHRWATTDGDGHYRFVGLAAGEYRVRVFAPDGWAPTTPQSITVTLGGDDGYLDADFGLAQGLPVTGLPIESFSAVGLVMLTLGGALLILDRRRRQQIPTP